MLGLDTIKQSERQFESWCQYCHRTTVFSELSVVAPGGVVFTSTRCMNCNRGKLKSSGRETCSEQR